MSLKHRAKPVVDDVIFETAMVTQTGSRNRTAVRTSPRITILVAQIIILPYSYVIVKTLTVFDKLERRLIPADFLQKQARRHAVRRRVWSDVNPARRGNYTTCAGDPAADLLQIGSGESFT